MCLKNHSTFHDILTRVLYLLPGMIFLLFIPDRGSAYFQQKVTYYIQVKLITELNRLEGVQRIIYVNNSPDSLNHLFMHLYVNRYAARNLPKNSPTAQYGYQEIISVESASGEELSCEVARTIMKVHLNKVLLPGDSVDLRIRFNTILPESADRFGVSGYHYDVGNWYPVPAVYDQFGWHIDQHYEGEFYQEWGDYHVEISVPRGFVVGATGILLNEEVLPDSVEFPERKAYYAIYPDTARITYRFHAPRVHDFAWTADPEYVRRTSVVDGTTLVFLILSYRLHDWEPQIKHAGEAFSYFNDQIGLYPYPYLTIADGYIKAGGIEYPNLVIINDLIYDSLSLSATIIHEIAHQWFYGILANNQTRYGWMDEGLTTYFENLGMIRVFGDTSRYVDSPGGWPGKLLGYRERFSEMDRIMYLQYIRQDQEEPINWHFDWYQGDPFTPYYQKMGLVMSQLRLLLGDTLFWTGIQRYYQEWKFRHPYPEDLISVFQEVSAQNLTWFFDQWLNTTWHCDYSVESFSGRWTGNTHPRNYDAIIRFRRNAPIVMPVDFRVYLANGQTRDFRIPAGDGVNFIPDSSQLLPAWSFTDREKSIHLSLPARIKRVELNPDNYLLDINPFNNSTRKFPRVHWYWLKRQYYIPHTDGYTVTLFPVVFYNQVDGLQLGLRTRGNFIFPDYLHRFQLMLGSRTFRPEVDLWFEHPLYDIHRDISLQAALGNAAGRRGAGLWLQWSPANRNHVSLFTIGWQWQYHYDNQYFPYPVSRGNLSLFQFALKKGFWKTGYLPAGWQVDFQTASSTPGSDFQYNDWSVEGRIRLPIPASQKLTLGLFTAGQRGDIPAQKALRFGGTSTFDYYKNPYLRTPGILPVRWWSGGNVFQEGGGNLRSLAGDWTPAGQNLINGFLSLTLGNPINLTYTYIPYISDVIVAGYTSWSSAHQTWGGFSEFRGEAGFSISFTRVPFIFNYFDIEQVHLDFPVWVSDNIDSRGLSARWVIRIDSRSFY